MFHQLAFTKSDTAATSNEDYPGVVDPWAPLNSASHYIVPQDCSVMAAYHQNAGATNARINIPAYRFVSTPSVQPVNRTAAPVTLSPIALWKPGNLLVPRLSELAFEASNDGAGAVRGVSCVWLRIGDFNVPQGDMYTIRATGTITAVTLTWTFGGIAFDQVLPPGNYAVVGMDVIGTNLVFARLQFPGGTVPSSVRPGVLARPSILIYQGEFFRHGNAGLFGTFSNTAIPNLEIFSNGANTAQTVYLDVIRLPG